MPSRNEDRFRLIPSGEYIRTDKQWEEAYDKEIRRRWRALVLVVRAKLEAIETGIASFEERARVTTSVPSRHLLRRVV